jgi:hypothetical protein
VSLLFANGDPDVPMSILGQPSGTVSRWWAVAASLTLALLGGWQVWVLERPSIRAQYMQPTDEMESRVSQNAG